MSLITEISTIVTALYPSATFVLSSKFQANIESYFTDPSALPLIVLDNELSKQASIQKNNNVLKDSKILISFLNLDSLENTDLQSETIRSEMEAMADRVAAQIYQLVPCRLITGNQKYKITPMFHVYNTNMTGVALEMQANYNEIVNFDIV